MLVGAYSNMPWFLAAWYALATAAGAWLLGTQLPAGFGDRLGAAVRPVAVPRGVLAHASRMRCARCSGRISWGRSIGSTLLSVIAYWLTFGFIEARHRHAQEARRKAKH